MVALPFFMSTANAEFRANGWGSNIRTQAGLPAAGMMSEIVGQLFFQVATDPANYNNRVWYIWFDGTNTLFQTGSGGPIYTLCYGRPYMYFTIPGQNSGDGIENYGGGWVLVPDTNAKIVIKYALFYTRRGELTLAAKPDGTGHRQTVILPWK